MEFSNLLSPSVLAAVSVIAVALVAALAWLDATRRTATMPTWQYLQERVALLSAARDEKISEIDRLSASLEVLRQEQGQLDEVRRQREQAQSELDEIQRRLLSLEKDRETVNQVRDALVGVLTEKSKVEQDLLDLREEQERLRSDIERMAGQQLELERNVAAKVAEREALVAETAKLTVERDSLERSLEKLGKEHDEVRSRHAQATAHVEGLRREGEVLSAQYQRLRDEQAAMQEGIKTATLQRESLSSEITNLTTEADRARQQLVRLEATLKLTAVSVAAEEAKLKEIRLQRDALHSEVEMLRKVLASLEGKVGPTTQDDVKEVLGELLKAPEALSKARNKVRIVDEKQALAAVGEHLKKQGLDFPSRLLNAFHTSIKIADISPLTVLAGISGTGKSELPRQYAWAMGLPFFQLAVQPRWDSPQDLFGFYNYLERRYKPTELARLMVHLDAKNWPKQAEPYKDRMALVLLDEMNLARVEYYFSEFLSRLEVRRDQDDAVAAEIELDLGRLPVEYRNKVYPVRRMLFVGTMNEDESTQTLSDKVVDRANILRFPRPKTLADARDSAAIAPEMDHYLPFPVWDGWHKRDQPDRRLSEWLRNLNSYLEGVGRPFGHRMGQAIAAYVINHPNGLASPAEAMADQLEMRIFPKLRGVAPDDDENRQSLDKVRDFIRSELRDEFLSAAFEEAYSRDLFVWRGIDRS